jgi:parallel beta-helix repeat protein
MGKSTRFSFISFSMMFCIYAFIFADLSCAKTIYVKTTGSDSNDGSTWELAKKTVIAGLNTAISGDQVWVAAGKYNERVTLKSGVALYGGFIGTETDLSQRNFVTNITILDGSKAGKVVTSPSGATTSTRIDGFTIQNGKTTSGGGIYCSSSSPTIINNIISQNSAGTYGSGGGIYCSDSSAIITNNTIINNAAPYGSGGGIFCGCEPTNNNNPTISNNIINGNTASAGGGGIYCCGYAFVKIFNNIISGNIGDGIGCYASFPAICNNTIINNNNGICLYRDSSVTIANNIIAFNTKGIYKSSSPTPVLSKNCLFNTTNYYGLSAGPNDIQEDPLFIDRTAGDFHLRSDSNCVNAGNDVYILSAWPNIDIDMDMDGQARINGNHIDIGADEWYPTITGTVELQKYIPGTNGISVTIIVNNGEPITKTLDAQGRFTLSGMPAATYSIYVKALHWLSNTQSIEISSDTAATFSLINGDANNDDVINILDLHVLADNWLEQTAESIEAGADLNGDNSVNLLDLAVLAQNYMIE